MTPPIDNETDYENLARSANEASRALSDVENASQKADITLRQNGKNVNELNAGFQKLGNGLREDFTSALTASIKGGENFSATFDKIRNTLEDFAIKFAIANPVENILFGASNQTFSNFSAAGAFPAPGAGGLFGDLLNGITGLFSARAFGGPVNPSTPYLVGEKGPELFVPQTAGRINPQVGSSPISITMNISTSDAASFRASQTQIAASMLDAARRAQRIR
jgi:hypothetical protein